MEYTFRDGLVIGWIAMGLISMFIMFWSPPGYGNIDESRFYESDSPNLSYLEPLEDVLFVSTKPNTHEKNESFYSVEVIDGKFYFLNCLNSTLKFDEDSIWCETDTLNKSNTHSEDKDVN